MGRSRYYNSGELFGAIDVALFILVIGGFLGVTMQTGRDPGGHRAGRRAAPRPRAADDPDPHGALRARRHVLRHGRGEPGVLRPGHHGDGRRRLRLAHRGRRHPARLRDRRDRLDHQPVRDRHRVRVRRDRHRPGPYRPDRDPRRGHGDRDLVGDALRRADQGRSSSLAHRRRPRRDRRALLGGIGVRWIEPR